MVFISSSDMSLPHSSLPKVPPKRIEFVSQLIKSNSEGKFLSCGFYSSGCHIKKVFIAYAISQNARVPHPSEYSRFDPLRLLPVPST